MKSGDRVRLTCSDEWETGELVEPARAHGHDWWVRLDEFPDCLTTFDKNELEVL